METPAAPSPAFESGVKDAIHQAAEFERTYGTEEAHRRIMRQILQSSGWSINLSAAKNRELAFKVAGTFADFVLSLGIQLNMEKERKK